MTGSAQPARGGPPRCSHGRAGVSPSGLVPALVLPAVVIVTLAERFLPYRPGWNRSQGDVGVDLIHLFVSQLTAPAVYSAALTVAVLPIAHALESRFGSPLWPSQSPLVVQMILALVIAELGQYWMHRWFHQSELGWSLHSVHHSPKRLYWVNTGRTHPFDVLLVMAATLLPLLALGVSAEALAAYSIYNTVHGLFMRSNVGIRLGPFNFLCSNVELHRWHHSVRTSEANHNFGSSIILWDIVFGTRYLPADRHVGGLGLSDLPDFPKGYLGQLAAPFRWSALRRLERAPALRQP